MRCVSCGCVLNLWVLRPHDIETRPGSLRDFETAAAIAGTDGRKKYTGRGLPEFRRVCGSCAGFYFELCRGLRVAPKTETGV